MGWGRRRLPLRAASAVALLVALAVTVGTTWGAHVVVRDQEHRLLKERAAEINLVLTSTIASIQTTLEEQGAILQATGGSKSAYERAGQAATTASGAPTTYAWLRPTSTKGAFVVIAAAGDTLRTGQVVDDGRASALAAAMHTPQLVSTRVIGAHRLLGIALGAPAAPAGTVLYREQALGPVVSPPRQASTAPFSELQVAIYATHTAQPTQVLASTTTHLPLRGAVREEPLAAGATQWLLTVKARSPLVGSVTANAQWFTLGVGVLGSLLIAVVIETVARRRDAALALYATEHHVAETLQRSLLPDLPKLPGLDIAARYLASGAGQQVGGDWFDVFPIAGDRVGLVVGDVIGHDLSAASAMAQIRAALRAYAIDGDSPDRVITRLERLVDALQLTQLVTVIYGVLDPPAVDGSRVLRYTNAGHMPPMVRRAAGPVETLTGDESVVIGAPVSVVHGVKEQVIEAGATIVMFTDGLVEVPGGSLDDGLRRLAETIAERDGSDAETMCEHVLATMPPRSLRDDIALLAVRIAGAQPPDRAEAPHAMAARAEGG